MKDYIFRLQLGISKIDIRSFMKEYLNEFLYFLYVALAAVCVLYIDSVVIIARSLTVNDVMIAATGVILWVLVAVETLDLMLPGMIGNKYV